MKPLARSALLLLALATLARCSASEPDQQQQQQQHQLQQLQPQSQPAVNYSSPGRANKAAGMSWLRQKLIKFADFKRLFQKRYRSSSEELLRHASYNERLARVAKSVVRYTNKLATTFDSINSRSDMTQREREQLRASRPASIVKPELFNQVEIVEEPKIELPVSPVDGQQGQQGQRADIFAWPPLNAPGSPLRPTAGFVEPRQPGLRGAAPIFAGWFSRFSKNFVKTLPQAQDFAVDLRSTNCFLPPGDQGDCNSCASFVAIAQLEYLHCRERDQLEKFSEQFPVDCGEGFGLMGCAGTDVHSLNRFISQVGLLSAAAYPYTGRQEHCPYYNTRTNRYNFKGLETLKLKMQGIVGAPASKWSEFLAQEIPLHVGVLITDEFEDYGGGIATSCDDSYGAHGMLLVGEGREEGVDYWLLRNSYGAWGDEGHYKLSKRARHCISDHETGYFPEAFLKTYGASFSYKLSPSKSLDDLQGAMGKSEQ